MTSKYLNVVRNMNETLPTFYKLQGSRILVELLPEPEMKTEGGLFVGSASNSRSSTEEDKFTAAVILAVGTGYYDDEGNDIPMDKRPGQIVEVVRSSLRYYSTHPILGGSQYTNKELATVNESAINAVLANSVEEYSQALTIIRELRAQAAR